MPALFAVVVWLKKGGEDLPLYPPNVEALSISCLMHDEQPTVQGWILHCKDFWENFHRSGFLCYKFIVLLSDLTPLFGLSHLR